MPQEILYDRVLTDNYVNACIRTTKSSGYEEDLNHYVMGLAEEATEILSIVEDHVFHGKWLNKDKLIDEMGDYLWYTVMLAKQMDYKNEGEYDTNYTCNFRNLIARENFHSLFNINELKACSNVLQINQWDSIEKQLLRASIHCATNAGSVLSSLKKHLHFNHPLEGKIYVNARKHHYESVMGYASISNIVGISIDEIAERNIEKLKKRYPEGFTEQASLNRNVEN